jgi:hypothetical protein
VNYDYWALNRRHRQIHLTYRHQCHLRRTELMVSEQEGRDRDEVVAILGEEEEEEEEEEDCGAWV